MSVILEKFLIKNNHTNFNKKDISLQLQTHPQNPSFRAITDTLDYFGIENVAANVPDGSLPSMPTNFLTIIDEDDPHLVLAVKHDNVVYCYSEDKKREKYTFSEFNKIWNKKVIAIEEATKKGANSVMLKIIGGISIVSILVAFLLLTDVTWTISFILLVSSIGLYISFLLVKEKLGYHSASVHSICTSTASSDCDEVINSKGAMLTKDISLADAGFLYFSILIFQNIFFGYNSISTLFIISSIPVIIYSIYYQAFEVKKWCPLCLGVAAVLIILNILVFRSISFNFTLLQAVEFLMSLGVLIPVFYFIKKLLVTQKSNEEKLIAANKFKKNPEILRNFMKEARTIEDLGMLQNEIRLGNPDADHKIIAYTNPFCGFCKGAFESYEKTIKAHPNVEIWIRFISDFKNTEEASTKITARFVELYFENGQAYFIAAYLEWFKDKNEKDWLKKYGEPKFEDKTISILKEQKDWAMKNSINHTPTTIIEGDEFPTSFGYEDFTQVISDIFEFQAEKRSNKSSN